MMYFNLIMRDYIPNKHGGINMNKIKNFHNWLTTIILASVVLWALFGSNSGSQDTKEKIQTISERVTKTGTLRCGYIQWPEFFMKEPGQDKFSGFTYEITESLASQLGLKLIWQEEVFFGQEAAVLASGRVDAICGANGPLNPASAKLIDFSDPLFYFPVYLYAPAEKASLISPEAIASDSFKISVMDGDVSQNLAIEKFPNAKQWQIPNSAQPVQLIMDVLTGKADATILDPITAIYFNRENDQKIIALSEQPLTAYAITFSVRPGETELIRWLNTGLAAMRNSGLSEKIIRKYAPNPKDIITLPKPY